MTFLTAIGKLIWKIPTGIVMLFVSAVVSYTMEWRLIGALMQDMTRADTKTAVVYVWRATDPQKYWHDVGIISLIMAVTFLYFLYMFRQIATILQRLMQESAGGRAEGAIKTTEDVW